MKKLLILTIILFSILAVKVNAQSIYNRNIDINVFYGSLEPYGEWIEIGYDDYVWRPYKSDYNWRPYGDGRWEWTKHGWYWESYEPFGWATYHYGRWFYDDYYGWVWMPDNVWAPAWVEWRYNDDYIGWAPLPPYASFNTKYGIHFSIEWNSGYTYWNFVKYNHFNSYNIHNYYVHNTYVKNVFNKTKYRTNYFTDNNRIVNGGISRTYIERKIGKRFTTRVINRTDNYKEYNSSDRKTRKGIVEYRPSEREISSRSFDKTNVTKGRTLNSLRTDKIEISRNKVDSRDNTSVKDRQINKNSNNESTNRSDRVINKNTDSGKGNTVERKVIKKESADRLDRSSETYSRDVIENDSRTKSLPDNTPSTISKSVNDREVIKRTENNTRNESKVNTSRTSEKKETSRTVTSESKSRR